MQPSTILAILSAFTPFAAAMAIDRSAAAATPSSSSSSTPPPIIGVEVEANVHPIQARSEVAKTFGSAAEATPAATQALQRRVAGLPDRMPGWSADMRYDSNKDYVLDIEEWDPIAPKTGSDKRLQCIEKNHGYQLGC